MNIPVRKLSLGQRIRCEIAASLLHRPEIVFLDEPTIGLDVVVRQKIRNLIVRPNNEEKVTIFLISHDMNDIKQLCKRAIIIKKFGYDTAVFIRYLCACKAYYGFQHSGLCLDGRSSGNIYCIAAVAEYAGLQERGEGCQC